MFLEYYLTLVSYSKGEKSMKRGSISKIASIVLVAGTMAFVGCGGGGGGGSQPPVAPSPTLTNGTASDGYISGATVCLDLNTNEKCNSDEPASVTDVNGSYSLKVTPAQKKIALNAKAPILLLGGIDIDSKKNLVGLLKAPYGGSEESVNVTPLTTLASALVEDKNVSIEEAYEKVAKAVGLKPEELKADPVKLAKKGEKKVIAKTMALHRIITTMASVTDDANDTADIYNALVDAIEQVTKSDDTNKTIAALVETAAQSDSSKLPPKAKKIASVATAIEKQVENAVKDSNTTLADAAIKIDVAVNVIQKNVVTAVENNETIDDSFIASVEDNATTAANAANPVEIAIKNIFTTFGITISQDDIGTIKTALNVTSAADVTIESIVKLDSDVEGLSQLKQVYKKRQLKEYVGKLGYTISDEALSQVSLKNFTPTMTKEAFAKLIYDTQNAELMTLALKINPPKGIASMSDIEKAKNLFASVRTQIKQADSFAQGEAKNIDDTLTSVTDKTTFTAVAFNTLSKMIIDAIDNNLTSKSKTVAQGNRTITVEKNTSSDNVVWNYTIEDVNGSGKWSGSVEYSDIDVDDFDPFSFDKISAKLSGTMPADYYGSGVGSQQVEANVVTTKTTSGAKLHIDANIVSDAFSVSVTDANLIAAYNAKDEEDTNETEPDLQYVELQNLYVQGSVGNYSLDGKLDATYGVNTIEQAKGFEEEQISYQFGVHIYCDDNNTSDFNLNGVKYKGIAPSDIDYSWVYWNDLKSEPVGITDIGNYSGLDACDSPRIGDNYDKGSDRDSDVVNSGHFPSNITFDGKLENTQNNTYLNAKIQAKWLDIKDANLSDENYEPQLDIAVNGTLKMSESATMQIGMTYKNSSDSKNVKITYVNGDVSITADSTYKDDNGTKVVNISSTAGVKATLTLNGDNTVDYSKSNVTNAKGEIIGKIEDRAGTPAVKYADGTFETLF